MLAVLFVYFQHCDTACHVLCVHRDVEDVRAWILNSIKNRINVDLMLKHISINKIYVHGKG